MNTHAHTHTHTSDKGITSLTRVLRKTEVLKLKKLKRITSEGLKSIATRSLKYINLSESTGITDTGIFSLVNNCPNIERLSVCELHKLTDASLTRVAAVLRDKLVSAVNSCHNYVAKAAVQDSSLSFNSGASE